MDAIRLGLQLRALRIRRRWRQLDVALRVGVSRGTISNIERGALASVSLETSIRVAAGLGADVDVRIRWRGEHLDRLLDDDHASLSDAFVSLLTRRGWETAVEVTFAIYGDRGSIDILAFHRASGTVLIVEIKTVVPDFGSMVSSIDRKSRLAIRIAAERGWSARTVGRLLVVADGSTARDRVARFDASLAAAFPDRGQVVRDWLRAPGRPLSGLLFFRNATGPGATGQRAGLQRVRSRRVVRNANVAGIRIDEGRGLPERKPGGHSGRIVTARRRRARPRDGAGSAIDRLGGLGYAPAALPPVGGGTAARRWLRASRQRSRPEPGEVNRDWQKSEWVRTRRSKAPSAASTRRFSSPASSPRLADASTTRSRA
jgi:transcriptional regulator with XRE-family HTH domain